jgi:HlyD family secretion protein
MKKTIFIILAALSLFVTACSTSGKAATATPEIIPTVIADDTIIAEGRVEPIQYAEIAFSTSGMVSEVMVKEGESVKAGQPLIHLGNASDTNYAAARLELVNAQHDLDELSRSRDTNLAQAEIDLKEAQKVYDKADHYLKYLNHDEYVPQTIYSTKLISTGNGWEYEYKSQNTKAPAPKEWIVDAENDLALKKAKLDEAQRVYDNLKDGPDAEQLPLLEARLDAAKAKVSAFAVIAPFDGVVAELKAKTGSSINAGEIAVTIADTSSWLVVTTDVTEIDVVKLKEGQPVTVTLDAIPNVTMKGKVLAIGQNYSENQGDIVYKVTVVLTEINPAMRWGMTAEVKFE